MSLYIMMHRWFLFTCNEKYFYDKAKVL